MFLTSKVSGDTPGQPVGASRLAWWGLIMTHADDDGLVLPPALAPAHVVLLPITMKAKDPKAVLAHCQKIADELRQRTFMGRAIKLRLMTVTSGVVTKCGVGSRREFPFALKWGSVTWKRAPFLSGGGIEVTRTKRRCRVMNLLPDSRTCFPISNLASWPKPKLFAMSTPR